MFRNAEKINAQFFFLPDGEELCLCGASADQEGRRHVVSGTTGRTEHQLLHSKTPFDNAHTQTVKFRSLATFTSSSFT